METSREAPRRRLPSVKWLILGIGLALVLGGTLGSTLLAPGLTIRGELESAAADLHSSHGGPDATVLHRLPFPAPRRHHRRERLAASGRDSAPRAA